MRRLASSGLVSFVFASVPLMLVSACSDDDAMVGDPGPGGGAGEGGDGGGGRPSGAGGSKAGASQGGSSGSATGGSGQAAAGEGGTGTLMEGGAAGAGGGGAEPGDTYVVTSLGRLLFVNRASGTTASAVEVTGLEDDETILGVDARPSNGQVYLLGSAQTLYSLNVETGAATAVATLDADPTDTSAPFDGLSGTSFGVDFNPVANRLRVVSDTGQNLRINVDAATDNTITDGALNPGTPSATAAAYTNSFGAACRTRLYVIDTATDELLLQDPPNDGKLTKVGALGVNGTPASAFEIVTGADGSNAAFAVFRGSIYDVSLTSGAAQNARAIELQAEESVVGVAILPPTTAPAQATGELLGATVGNKLVSFNSAAPGKLCTSVALSGLGAEESVLGIDVRPIDGALYATGSSGKLYTVNVATGVATIGSTLGADPADTTDAFAGLAAGSYGVGFNPVPDRLRVVSDAGRNLRINVTSNTGVITDAALNPGSPDITAVAYTNSFAGTRATTLFGLDTTTDSLVVIGSYPAVTITPAPSPVCPTDVGNPNCGIINVVGPLGIGDVSGINGFDIDARAGTALAALAVGNATSSSLYAIDLATGAATNPPGVANPTIGGGELLVGLAYAANPSPVVVGLTNDDRVVRFSPSSPNTLLSNEALTGLQNGETLLGLDLRPLDGKVYGVSSSGRLLAVDPVTGTTSAVATLVAAAGDDNPFTALTLGAGHGVDFNPLPDLLRVVDPSDQNLRIVPSARTLNTVAQVTGATFEVDPIGRTKSGVA
jgi:Domain of unknown function (DUF4394)